MHKLTRPDADCPKCGCENALVGRPRYQETGDLLTGVYGVMIWNCDICGFEQHTEPLDGKAPRPAGLNDA